jgi:thioredoxin reductase (NADPH)
MSGDTLPPTPEGPIETDALVVGAGPAGLFQVFELGLLEIRAHVVDSLPSPGGQCIELYPDKPIYDIPAVPVCTGRELVDRLMRQIAPFDTPFHLGQQVSSVHRQAEDGRFHVETTAGLRFLARTVFVAGGVGSFLPRQMKVDGLDAHLDTQVFHAVGPPGRFAGQDVVIAGGGEPALDGAVRLLSHEDPARRPRRVVLLHRRDVFQARPELLAQVRQLRGSGQLDFVAGQVTGIREEASGRLAALQVTDAEALTHDLPLDSLLVLMGLSPRLGPIADWGLALERRQVVVDTEKFETSVPGIFAVGDVNTYPGKKKLILSGFHEATLAAFAAAAYVFPERRVQLQYTTTSTRLHQVLGVTGSPPVDETV